VLVEDTNRTLLSQALSTDSVSVGHVKRAVCLVTHRLAGSEDRDTVSRDLLLLLASIMEGPRSALPSTDLTTLKDYIFNQSVTIRALCLTSSLSNIIREGRFFSLALMYFF
jgi:hypothetical protein